MNRWSTVTGTWRRVGPRAVDVTAIVVALLAVAAETLARRHGTVAHWLIVPMIGLPGVMVLWWRRSHALAATMVGVVVLAATSLPVTIVVGLCSLAVRRRDRVLVAAMLIVAAAFAVFSVRDGSKWASAALSGLVIAGFCAAAGAYVGARRDLVTALRERAERAEAERELRAEQAALAERARIAREMHDVLAHKVSLIALHAGALEVSGATDPARVHDTAALIRTTARDAMQDLRDALGVLRSGELDERADLTPPPTTRDIASVVDASRVAGVRAELTMDIDELPPTLARTVHRVVREGLTNVHKHARDSATSVSVTGDQTTGVTVQIVNRRPVLPGSGVGLLGLRERVAIHGGTFSAGPERDGDWHLTAWLPWTTSNATLDERTAR
jgi:signal transduction histidine kinase